MTLAWLVLLAGVLEASFPSPDISWLVLDASGTVVEARWEDGGRPVPAGSLVKPFTALAYGASHDWRFPVTECHGERDGCWRPGGHGRVGITAALAHSCNAYFLGLASGVTPEGIAEVALRFGLEAPPPSADAMAGLRGLWRIAPIALAHAYLELARRKEEPGVRVILEGMSLCAREGTGKAARLRALMKTGTAPCAHSQPAPGDGFAVALAPEVNPRRLLLVRLHGQPGSRASAIAGQMMRLLR